MWIELAKSVEIIPAVLSKSAGQCKTYIPPSSIVCRDVNPLTFYCLSQTFHVVKLVAGIGFFAGALLLCLLGLRYSPKVCIRIMRKKTCTSNVPALLVGSNPISLCTVLKQTLKILLMIFGIRAVNLYHPFQTTARRAAEEQSCHETFVLQQTFEKTFNI